MKSLTRFLSATAVIGLVMLLAASQPVQAQDYDLVILGGRVIDPDSKLDAVRNVGVKDGKIAVITADKIQGKETIDAKGHVVAPGFIDMHNHNAGAPFGQRLALRDGVTTPMEIEAGVYPVNDWYAALKGKSRSNYGASVGMVPIREFVFNDKYVSKFAGDFLLDMQTPDETHTSMMWSTQIATDDQIEKIGQMLEEGLAQGALGIGHLPGYAEFGLTQRESNLAQRIAGEHKTFTAVHGRFSSQMPPTSGLLSIQEMMAPQAVYGGGIVFQHLTAQTLSVTPAALKMIDDARDQGAKVLAEIYPYSFGSTIVGADYLHPDNYQKNMGRDYKDITEVATMKPLTKDRYDELIKTAPSTSVMFNNATDQTVYDALANPNTVLGSDSYPYTLRQEGGGPAIAWDTPFDGVNGHPRGAGAHARFLRLVREKKIDIPLDLAIAKMTSMIAQFLQDNGVEQMAHKGRVQVGADADLTIFDPDKVTDNSTMKDGGLPSTGIPYVVVNGTIVVKDSVAVDDVFPGQAVRGSVTKGN
jgi:N-acyl-D-aspartate/D-glutamate deacylase